MELIIGLLNHGVVKIDAIEPLLPNHKTIRGNETLETLVSSLQ
jgi:hypothetical protein